MKKKNYNYKPTKSVWPANISPYMDFLLMFEITGRSNLAVSQCNSQSLPISLNFLIAIHPLISFPLTSKRMHVLPAVCAHTKSLLLSLLCLSKVGCSKQQKLKAPRSHSNKAPHS